MKIRQGFVSNSSTSSFCIYGTVMTEDEIIKRLKSDHKALLLLSEQEELNVNFLDDLFDVEEGDWFYESIGWNDIHYIGRSLADIKDDETGIQFKNNIKKILEKYFDITDLKFGIHQESFES